MSSGETTYLVSGTRAGVIDYLHITPELAPEMLSLAIRAVGTFFGLKTPPKADGEAERANKLDYSVIIAARDDLRTIDQRRDVLMAALRGAGLNVDHGVPLDESHIL